MAQILTDIYEGYIMYSEMVEYKSIRNFRFKKLKKYKIAKMKHQLHTLKDIGNYKPNLVVRVLTHLWKTQKCLWGSVVGMFKVGSTTNQLRGYTHQSFDKPKQIEKVEEPRKITHAKYLGDGSLRRHSDFTVGKVYKIEEYIFYEHVGNEYIKLYGDKKGTKWIFKTKGDTPSWNKFELIYDGYNLVEDYKEIYEVYRQTNVVPPIRNQQQGYEITKAYEHHRNQVQNMYQQGMMNQSSMPTNVQ